MGNLFGIGRRAPEVTAVDRAILRLKQQRDKIKIYQKKTEADLAKNADLALKLFQSGMKDRALIVLRRKKVMVDILARTDNQLATLESMVSDIEFTQIEVSVVEGLKVGTEALKQLNSLMNIDDIQQMMDDNAEAAEKQREISAILSQNAERYDENDLLKELEGYQAAETAANLDKLPKVPEGEPISEEIEQSADITTEPALADGDSERKKEQKQENEAKRKRKSEEGERSGDESGGRRRVLVEQ